MADVLIGPPDRGCGPVVVSDVAQELAREILHRGEDAARNHVALDLREPDLYLVHFTSSLSGAAPAPELAASAGSGDIQARPNA